MEKLDEISECLLVVRGTRKRVKETFLSLAVMKEVTVLRGSQDSSGPRAAANQL